MERLRAGQGTKTMAFADGPSIPLALYTEGASPHGVVLAGAALASAFLTEKPKRPVGGKAYDSHPLDEALQERCAEVIAARRKGRKRKKTQGGRKLRRYKRRWKTERLFARFAKPQEAGGPLRIQGRDLPGFGATRVHHRSARKVFMRWLLVKPLVE